MVAAAVVVAAAGVADTGRSPCPPDLLHCDGGGGDSSGGGSGGDCGGSGGNGGGSSSSGSAGQPPYPLQTFCNSSILLHLETNFLQK